MKNSCRLVAYQATTLYNSVKIILEVLKAVFFDHCTQSREKLIEIIQLVIYYTHATSIYSFHMVFSSMPLQRHN